MSTPSSLSFSALPPIASTLATHLSSSVRSSSRFLGIGIPFLPSNDGAGDVLYPPTPGVPFEMALIREDRLVALVADARVFIAHLLRSLSAAQFMACN
jgi:hypothetical protein